jgi:hypothetical protein
MYHLPLQQQQSNHLLLGQVSLTLTRLLLGLALMSKVVQLAKAVAALLSRPIRATRVFLHFMQAGSHLATTVATATTTPAICFSRGCLLLHLPLLLGEQQLPTSFIPE